MAKKSKPKPDALAGFKQSVAGIALRLDALDKNPAIRKALIDRIVKAAETAPVVVLHQIAQQLDMLALSSR